MKFSIKPVSHGVLLGSSLITASITPALANDTAKTSQKIELAMLSPAAAMAAPVLKSGLNPQKMLAMADSLQAEKMSKYQQKLQFALIYSAANKGLAEAQFRLANYYIDSELVRADENEATFWLEEAMAQGHQGAKFVYENIGFDIGC